MSLKRRDAYESIYIVTHLSQWIRGYTYMTVRYIYLKRETGHAE